MSESPKFEFSSVPKSDLLHDVSKQPRIENWDEYFLAIAFLVARKSKDPSTKTGCVVVRDNRILTTGFNGFAMGCPDAPELYADRTYKYANIVHCDTNAVLQGALVGVSLDGATMYLTGPPCSKCTQAITQSGIELVIWPAANKFECDAETGARWAGDAVDAPEQDAQAILNLESAGIEWRRFGIEEQKYRVFITRSGVPEEAGLLIPGNDVAQALRRARTFYSHEAPDRIAVEVV